MNIKNLFTASMIAALCMTGIESAAGNIDATRAQESAHRFLISHVAQAPGTYRAPVMPSLTLAHAEASQAVSGANDYYAFNIAGGGFIIIAGDDRASEVLGYSDKGHLDFNNLPDNFKALMRSYQEEIEYLQSHPDLKASPIMRASDGTGVAPLIKTTWGQEMPYDLQCPVYQGEYCVVGCVATAMAQVMYYWRYPASCGSIGSYYCYSIGQTIPSLPPASFDYNKMLLSYCHWDWDNSQLVQDEYTDEQAQEVAKLSRYCGQAVDMDYSPEGSGAYTFNQLAAMKSFGYNSNARDEMRSGWWSTNYTTEQWEAMLKEELDKQQPILYSASDPAAGGHAFICDGYNAEGLFHFNFGWYGTCDGWYVSTALNMTHRDGDNLKFNSNHEVLLDVVPPIYCLVSTTALDASRNMVVLGDALQVEASDIKIKSSEASTSLVFDFTDNTGKRVCASNAINVNVAAFEQGSTQNATITLPATLAPGQYRLNFYYFLGSNVRTGTRIDSEGGTLHVVGRLAKYETPFDISDVTTAIGYVLEGTHDNVDISDIVLLIKAILDGNY